MKGKRIESKLKKTFEGTQKAWNQFFKRVINVAAPFTGMAVGAKIKNRKMGQAMTNILKTLSGRRISSSNIQRYGIGLRLRVMFSFFSKKVSLVDEQSISRNI